ncbi:MAG: hypothetical protein ABIK33_05625 [candidate division WOR-3 bacterium]
MSRIDNWDKHFSLHCPKRLLKLKPLMRKRLAEEFQALEMLENEVKKIMGKSGLPTWQNVAYLNFARQIYGLRKRYTEGALQREINIRLAMAQQKMLKKSLLKEILKVVLSLPMPKHDN